jgi:hypothetical protein
MIFNAIFPILGLINIKNQSCIAQCFSKFPSYFFQISTTKRDNSLLTSLGRSTKKSLCACLQHRCYGGQKGD